VSYPPLQPPSDPTNNPGNPYSTPPGDSNPFGSPSAPNPYSAPPATPNPYSAPPATPNPYSAPPASPDPYSAAPYSPGQPQSGQPAYGQQPGYGQQPAYGQQPQFGAPQKAPGTKVLGMPLGLFIGLIIGVLVLCCGGGIAACFLGGYFDSVTNTASDDPTVTVTGCEVNDDDEFLPETKVTLTVKNNGSSTELYLIDIELRNASGTKVGDTIAVVDVGPNETVTEETTLYQDDKGGTECVVTDIT
jgi:hypothetical protein